MNCAMSLIEIYFLKILALEKLRGEWHLCFILKSFINIIFNGFLLYRATFIFTFNFVM